MRRKNLIALNHKDALKKNDIYKIYSKFKSQLNKYTKNKPFTVAVSGGPDSLALTALSQIYRNQKKIKIYFVLIDHAIRKNSKKEANLVKKLLKRFGISLYVIRNKNKIKNNIQKKAREVRYKLLLNFCKRRKIRYILTAHHSDDQIETFLIRLSRGSGIQGLSSMDKDIKLSKEVKLIRPLLEFKKQELKYIAKKSFGKVFKDPTNVNKKYLRTKVRSLKKQLEKSGIHHDQILRSINNLASTRDTLNNYLKRVVQSSTKKVTNKVLVNLKEIKQESEEIKLKLLSMVIKNFSKSYYPPRSKKVLNALKRLNSSKKTKLTLGGCLLEKSGNYLYITKEMPRKNH